MCAGADQGGSPRGFGTDPDLTFAHPRSPPRPMARRKGLQGRWRCTARCHQWLRAHAGRRPETGRLGTHSCTQLHELVVDSLFLDYNTVALAVSAGSTSDHSLVKSIMYVGLPDPSKTRNCGVGVCIALHNSSKPLSIRLSGWLLSALQVRVRPCCIVQSALFLCHWSLQRILY